MTARWHNILLGFAVVCLSFIMLWGITGWYLTKDAHQQLSTFLQENFHNNALNSLDAELLSYKTNVIGATASIRLSSKIAFIDEQIGELFLRAKLYYGPVFIDDGAVHLGKVLWKISLDPLLAADYLAESSQTQLGEIFKSNQPFLSLFTDFDNTLRYHGHIRALATASLRADHIILNGILSANSLQNQLQINANNLSFIGSAGLINIPVLMVDLAINKQKFRQQTHISYTTKPFTLHLSSLSGLASKRTFVSMGNLAQINHFLLGKLQLKTQRTEDLELMINLRDISMSGYQQLLQTEARAFNLKQQIDWTLEENAETPEGQDHIWQLNNRIEQQRSGLTELVAKKMLSKKTSLIKVSLDINKNATILPEFIYQKLVSYSKHGVINQIDHHYQFVINSVTGKLLVNNNPMTWDDFLGMSEK